MDQVVSFLDSGIVGWCEEIDLPSLCLSNHKQLLELKVLQYIEAVRKSSSNSTKTCYGKIDHLQFFIKTEFLAWIDSPMCAESNSASFMKKY